MTCKNRAERYGTCLICSFGKPEKLILNHRSLGRMTGKWRAVKIKNTEKYCKKMTAFNSKHIPSSAGKFPKNTVFPKSKEELKVREEIQDSLCKKDFAKAFDVVKRSKSDKLLEKGFKYSYDDVETEVFGKESGYFNIATETSGNMGGGGAKFDADPMLNKECYHAALRGFLTEIMLTYVESSGLSTAAGVDDIAKYIPPGPLCEQFGANVAKSVIQRAMEKDEFLPSPEDMSKKDYFIRKIAEFKANVQATRFTNQAALI